MAYFPFRNDVLQVKSNGVERIGYNEITDHVIWDDHIIEWEIGDEPDGKSEFQKFIQNITGVAAVGPYNERYRAATTANGYMLHNYNPPSNRRAVVLYDEEVTDTNHPQGGTGKGIIGNAINCLRDVAKVDGKRFQVDNRFRYQNVTDRTQVFWLDDPDSSLKFEVFHSIITDGFEVEAKHRSSIRIDGNHAPKVLISSNRVLESYGVTNQRRQLIIELAPYYNNLFRKGLSEPVKSEHGNMMFFSDDWPKEEWNRFYWFMFRCVQRYLQNGGLYEYDSINLNHNLFRQNVPDTFYQWVTQYTFESGEEYIVKELMEDFESTYGPHYPSSTQSFNKWLEMFAATKKWSLLKRHSAGKLRIRFTPAETPI